MYPFCTFVSTVFIVYYYFEFFFFCLYFSSSFLLMSYFFCFFFFSSRRRHTRCLSDWSSDVCSSDLPRRADTRRAQQPTATRRRRHPAGQRSARPAVPSRPDRRAGRVRGCLRHPARSEERRVGKE